MATTINTIIETNDIEANQHRSTEIKENKVPTLSDISRGTNIHYTNICAQIRKD